MSQPSLPYSSMPMEVPNPMKVESQFRKRREVKVPHHYEDEELVAAKYSPPTSSGFDFNFTKKSKFKALDGDDPMQQQQAPAPTIVLPQHHTPLLTALSGQYRANQSKKISAEVLRQKLSSSVTAHEEPRSSGGGPNCHRTIYEDIEAVNMAEERGQSEVTAFKSVHKRSRSLPVTPITTPDTSPKNVRKELGQFEKNGGKPKSSWLSSMFTARESGMVVPHSADHKKAQQEMQNFDKKLKTYPAPNEPQFFHQQQDGLFFEAPKPVQQKECQKRVSMRDVNVFSPTSM